MRPLSKCPSCGLDLGLYVETHCPQCGMSLSPKPPMPAGIWLLNLMLTICGTVLVLTFVGWFVFYMNSSSSAELYEGAPYHAATFRVISVQYSPPTAGIDGGSTPAIATAAGIVEGQKEGMDLLPYVYPHDRAELMQRFPEGMVIPVYLFPTLRGVNRIQPLRGPPAETYRRQATWALNRALPVVGAIGMLTALLGLGRFFLWRSRTVAN
jgi:energy-coupling factor transporter transmembrane protein EcfT